MQLLTMLTQCEHELSGLPMTVDSNNEALSILRNGLSRIANIVRAACASNVSGCDLDRREEDDIVFGPKFPAACQKFVSQVVRLFRLAGPSLSVGCFIIRALLHHGVQSALVSLVCGPLAVLHVLQLMYHHQLSIVTMQNTLTFCHEPHEVNTDGLTGLLWSPEVTAIIAKMMAQLEGALLNLGLHSECARVTFEKGE